MQTSPSIYSNKKINRRGLTHSSFRMYKLYLHSGNQTVVSINLLCFKIFTLRRREDELLHVNAFEILILSSFSSLTKRLGACLRRLSMSVMLISNNRIRMYKTDSMLIQ